MANKNDKSNYIEIIKGNISGLLLFMILLILFSAVIYKTNTDDKFYIPMYAFILIISGFFSGFTGTVKYRKNGIVNGLISSVLPATAAFISSIIASTGFSWIFILIPVMTLLSSQAGGIIAVNIKHRKKRRK